jgi:D-beta-D-heptose 7-phosphate kinase/D-beta-D-heptose 1-phosphate adenosyltransferase
MKKTDAIPARIKTLDELLQLAAGWRLNGKKIAFTNGVFDLLHPGHLYSLSQAAALADYLVVAVNGDASVKRLKGPNRPIHDESARALVLASLLVVDAVIIFHEDSPETLIQALLPDVLVKGGDYAPEAIAGAAAVMANGGQVVINPLIPGISTTTIIDKMKGG